MEKSIYKISQEIAKKIKEKEGKVSSAHIKTMAYLNSIDKNVDPVQDFIDQHVRRYR